MYLLFEMKINDETCFRIYYRTSDYCPGKRVVERWYGRCVGYSSWKYIDC